MDHYEVYVDGAGTAAASVTTNVWMMTAPTLDGQQHPLFPGRVCHYRRPALALVARHQRDHLERHTAITGFRWSGWTSTGGTRGLRQTVPLISGGPTPLQVFLSGGDPLDPSTWLRTAITRTAQGFFLGWNPQPGLHLPGAKSSTNLKAWVNVGSPRFAAGNVDSIYLGGNNSGYYRVL